MSASGIAFDTYTYLLRLLNPDKGIQYTLTTNGSSSQSLPILKDYDRVCPAITILNTSSGTCYIGYGGFTNSTSGFTLLGGAAITLRYLNPSKRKLVVNDGGTAVTLNIVG